MNSNSNPKASELFRFVSVRSLVAKEKPKPLVQVRYPGHSNSQKGGGLYPKLLELVKKEAPAKERAQNVQETLGQFKSSKQFLGKHSAYADTVSTLLDLQGALRASNSNRKDHFSKIIASTLGQKEKDIRKSAPELQYMFWDNLIYACISTDAADLREKMVIGLRMLNLLQRTDDNNYASREQLEEAPVLLPANLFPFHRHFIDENIEIPSSKAEIKPLQQTNDRLVQSFAQAEKEILDLLAKRNAEAARQDAEKNAEKRSTWKNKIEPEVFEKFSPELRDFLREIDHLPQGEDYQRFLNQMADKVKGRLTQLPEAGVAAHLVQVGGNRVEMEVEPQLSKRSSSSPQSYSGYYLDWWPEEWQARPLRVGDLLKVEQTIHCYEPGEVAHIENVLRGEAKSFDTRRLSRSEVTTTEELEHTTEEERESQSTSRHEMERATSEIVHTDMGFKGGMSLSADYGVVKMTANAEFSVNTSSDKSTEEAYKLATSVTEKARNKVVLRTKSTRTSKQISEFEVKHQHSIDNQGSTEHTVGIYRWVDKIYKNRLVNYGKRTFFEFYIPEPGRLYRWLAEKSGTILDKPRHPSENHLVAGGPLLNYKQLNASNYGLWATAYGIELPAPPEYYRTIPLSLAIENDSPRTVARNATSKLLIPEGYLATGFRFHGRHSGHYAEVFIGTDKVEFRPNEQNVFLTGQHEGEVSVSAIGGNIEAMVAHIKVIAERTDAHYEQWQIRAYTSLIRRYEYLMELYEEAASEIVVGTIQGRNPGKNQEMIRDDLRRWSIELLRSGYSLAASPWNSLLFDDAYKQAPGAPPYLEAYKSIPRGRYVQFIENAFEWENMTYQLFPYFWADAHRARVLHSTTDNDTSFENFLRAGYARVLVPARPGFEMAAVQYHATGKIPDGLEYPLIDAAIYTAWLDESQANIEQPDVEPWLTRLPTNLVILQEDANGIPGEGLPCNG